MDPAAFDSFLFTFLCVFGGLVALLLGAVAFTVYRFKRHK